MIPSREIKEIYTATLNQQKKIIKTNRYAQELEKRYHKQRHFQHKIPKNLSTLNCEEINWPINSHAFTQALISKLQDIPSKNFHPSGNSKKLIQQIKQSLKNHRLQSAENHLPRLDKTRY